MEPLAESGTHFYCVRNHHFDKAKEGYANLLLANEKNSKDPGDSASMVQARAQIFSKNFYKKPADALAALCLGFPMPIASPVIADSGCGEGYYLHEVRQAFVRQHSEPLCIGIDVSKHAIRLAARRYADSHYVVASVKKLPFSADSIDILLNIFAPRNFPEFSRTMKNEGYLIIVSPGPRHLEQLKDALALSVEPHVEPVFDTTGTQIHQIRQEHLQDEISLTSAEDVFHLCHMTPFWWKLSQEGRQKVATMNHLTVTLDFVITVFQKK
ncbi:MAG: Ribosomal large subunit methyltransferase [Candidatus Peribacteria bacterium]|nr:Ribosomal large subunit methyltransferase [Candidatus Peribacteria bacterium]